MKRRMAETSLEAYEYLKANNKLSPSRRAVYECLLENGVMSAKEIAKRLNKPLHTISGRITELKDLGLIEVVGRVRENNTSYRLLKAKVIR